MKLKNLETINSSVDSISKNLICLNGICTCHLSSGQGYCQVCADSSGFLAGYDNCNSYFCEKDPNSGADLALDAKLPFDSPVYNQQRFFVDIDTSKLTKIDLIDNEKKTNLCSHCDSYNKMLRFKEGKHDIIISAFVAGESEKKSFSFFIDTKKPRIKKTLPLYNSKANRENAKFAVYYDEDNVESIELYYGFKGNMTKLGLTDCSDGKNQQCFVDIDLSQYSADDKIYYYFNITDIAGNSAVSSYLKFSLK